MNPQHLPSNCSCVPIGMAACTLAAFFSWTVVHAQPAPIPTPALDDEPTIELAPFEVNAEQSNGYVATNTLGGTRIRTDLVDVGSAISVYTAEFLQDLGAFDNETLLAYTVSADVGGVHGTFVNANSQGEENENFGAGNSNTRIRGLAAADNTMNYFKSETSWDSYNTGRVEMVRGANSILFGLGSPAGIINSSTNRAGERKSGRVDLRFDQFGSRRVALDYNQPLIKNQLAVRFDLLDNDQKFRQEPAFKHDRRFYATAKIAPRFMQGRFSTFKLDVSAEFADIEQNTRRGQPPVDRISTFFLPRSQGGLEGRVIDRNNPADQQYLFLDYGLPSQRANPLINTGWGNGTTVMVYNRTVQPVAIFEKEINSVWGYRFLNNAAHWNQPAAVNSSATSISGTVQPVFINGMGSLAQVLNKPYATSGRWQDQVLTDTTYYNFYDHLIDGNSKREFSGWRTWHADLSHTFFNHTLGYNLQYFRQELDTNRYAALGGASFISVDASALLPDGTPNPWAGRAYLRESPYTGQRATTADRDALRATLYAENDFRKRGAPSWLGRILGRHYVTGSVAEQTVKQTRFDYMAMGVGPSWVENRLVDSLPLNRDPFQTRARLLNYFYVSDSLAGSQPGQIPIQNIGPSEVVRTGTYQYRYFDAHRDYFNPNVSPTATDPVYGRALQNPANYRGWMTGPIDIVGAATDAASREYLTRARDYFQEKISTKSLVWQGKFGKGAFVGTYGWREDKYKSWQYTWDQGRDLLTAWEPERANFGFDPIVKTGETRNWSAVAHVHGLWRRLPFNLTLQYNEGQNTNPDPARIGVFRNPVLSAQGRTKDVSVVMSDRDNRINLRVTKFKTSVRNASSTSTLQSQKYLLEQTFTTGFDNVYRILKDKEVAWGSVDPVLESRVNAGTATAAERTTYANQLANVPKHVESANAWLAMEGEFAQRFPQAVSAWSRGGFNPSTNDPSAAFSYPENAVLLEDTVSKGYEFEVTANLTRQWRLSANASRIESVRDNLPGPEFAALMDFVWEKLNGPAGQVPFALSSGVATDTAYRRFSGFYDSYLLQLQNNGQVVRELSKWRYNVLTNYTFSTGWLKALSLGVSYRYEDPKVIGYGLKTVESRIVTDIDNPYYSEAVHTFGWSARYSRKLKGGTTWSVQLNVSNAFQGNRVVATSTQPDGTIARGMIREGSSWTVSNTFAF